MGFPLPKVGFPPPTLKRFRYSYSWNRFQLSRNSFFRTNFRSLQKVQYLKLNFWLKSVLLEFPKASTYVVPKNTDVSGRRISSQFCRQKFCFSTGLTHSEVLLCQSQTYRIGLRTLNLLFRVDVDHTQCDQKKLLNVNKSSPKKISVDFDTFTKIALECGRFVQINCCQRL